MANAAAKMSVVDLSEGKTGMDQKWWHCAYLGESRSEGLGGGAGVGADGVGQRCRQAQMGES